MKWFIRISLMVSATVLFNACSDDFVNDRFDISGVAESAIFISPTWEADYYQFQCVGAGNGEFSIESKPDWLKLDDLSGQFSNDMTSIRGEAHTQEDYNKPGVYIDQMLVSSRGKKYAVPLYYITEGNPSVHVTGSISISPNSYNNQMEIYNLGDGVLIWDIVSLPDWLTVDRDAFNPGSVLLGKNGSATIPFNFDIGGSEQNIMSGLTGSVWLRTNDKDNPEVEIEVTVNLGTPQLYIYTYYLPLNFGTSNVSMPLAVGNDASGILAWSFEDLPDWLSVSKQSGLSYGYSNFEVYFTCDRSLLEPGLNSATIYLKSNDPDQPAYPISVSARAPGENVNIKVLEGSVSDAAFDKSTNILYYVAGQPNTLVAYDVTARAVLYTIPLGKAPTCMALTEDFARALVGHGGSISVVDLNGHSVTKTIEVSGVLADIEWAANDWCAYTQAGNYDVQHTAVYWVDLSNGSSMEGSSVYEDCMIKKVPGQDYIIGSETEVSSGVYVYNINDRSEKADVFESFREFWFVGNHIISSRGYVYRLSDVISIDGYSFDGLSSIGRLSLSGDAYYYTFPWMEYSSASHSIFALSDKDYETVSGKIYQFEDNDFTLTQTYYYEDFYQPDAQTSPYEVQAHYLFANDLGTELSVMRKGKNNNIWSVEFIPLQD